MSNNFKNVVSDFSADNTGATNVYTPFINALAGLTISSGIFIPKGTYKLSTNLTIPADVDLVFDSGAVFSIDSGVTLTINGGVQGGLSQKFSGAGSVSFPYGAQIDQVFCTWFGASPGGSSDVGPAFIKAMSSLNNGGGIVLRVPTGNYCVNSTIAIPTTVGRVKMRGDGFSKSVLVFTPSSSVADNVCISIPAGQDRVEIEGIGLSAASVSGKRTVGLKCELGSPAYTQTSEVYLKDFNVHGFNKYGLHINCPALYFILERCRFDEIRNSTAQGGDEVNPAYAIYTEGVNYLNKLEVASTRFSYNDGVFKGFAGGAHFRDCEVERCGNGTAYQGTHPNGLRTNQGHIMDFCGTTSNAGQCTVVIENCWLELNLVDGNYFLIHFYKTLYTRISNNSIGCESGYYGLTRNVVSYDNACYANEFNGNRVSGDRYTNNLVETKIKWLSVDSASSNVKARDNSFSGFYPTSFLMTSIEQVLPQITADKVDLFMVNTDEYTTPTCWSSQTAGDAATHLKLSVGARASTNPSAGFGASLGFALSRSNGGSGPTVPSQAGDVTVQWENPGAGTEQGAMRFHLNRSGTISDVGGISSLGLFDYVGSIEKSKLVTSNMTLAHGDGHCYLNASGLTVTVPDASTEPDRIRTCKLIQTGNGTLVSNNIEGTSAYVLGSYNKYVTLHSVNGVWRVIANN